LGDKTREIAGPVLPGAPFGFCCCAVRNCAHRRSSPPGAEKGQTAKRSCSSNRVFARAWRPLSVSPRRLGAAAIPGSVERNGAHVGTGPEIALRCSHLSVARRAPSPCAFRPEHHGGRFDRTCRPIGWCSHWSPAAVQRGSESPPDRALCPTADARLPRRHHGQGSCSTKAGTRFPSRHWPPPSSAPQPHACLSPGGLERSETGARRALWLAANAPESTQSPTRQAPAQSASAASVAGPDLRAAPAVWS